MVDVVAEAAGRRAHGHESGADGHAGRHGHGQHGQPAAEPARAAPHAGPDDVHAEQYAGTTTRAASCRASLRCPPGPSRWRCSRYLGNTRAK